MKIKLDENLPNLLVSQLEYLGHDVDTVQAEQLAGRDDETIWHAAQADGRFLVTQALDFSDVRRYRPGTHMGLLLIRLAKPGRLALVACLKSFSPPSLLTNGVAASSWLLITKCV